MSFVDSDHLFLKSVSGIPKLFFGRSSITELAREVGNKKFKKVLVVGDQGVFSAGWVEKVVKLLNFDSIEVKEFHNIASEPNLATMREASKAGFDFNPDCVVGLGGGSAMDTAKVVSMLLQNKGKLEEYVEGRHYNSRIPLYLVPTTSGTGSEVTGDAVFSVNDQKKWISHECLIPDMAILDPELAVSMPRTVTASTGLDVLCHALEGLMTTYRNEIVQMYAAKAVALTMNNLEKAYFCGIDIKARYNMMLAAMFGGLANNNAPATFPHSIGYTLANRFKVPHGFSCAIGLPATMEFNLPMCIDIFSSIFDACEFEKAVTSKKGKAVALIEEIRLLITKVNGYSRLREVGVKEDMLDLLAEECFKVFPRPYNICQYNKEDIQEMYQKMF